MQTTYRLRFDRSVLPLLLTSFLLHGCVAESEDPLDGPPQDQQGPLGESKTLDAGAPALEDEEFDPSCAPPDRGPGKKPSAKDAGKWPFEAGHQPSRQDAGIRKDAGKPLPLPDKPLPECSGRTFGDGKTCVPYELLKSLAASACEVDGSALYDLKVGDECPGGATTGWAQCCFVEEPPHPECETIGIKDGYLCGPNEKPTIDAALKEAADETCAASGLQLSTIEVEAACEPGEPRTALVTCCGVFTPPPPPSSCWGKVVGDGVSCLDEKAVVGDAESACSADGRRHSLDVYFERTETCPSGGVRAKIECCLYESSRPESSPPNG